MMTDQLLKASNNTSKNHDRKKDSPSSNSQGSSKKQSRKGENPTQFRLTTDQSAQSNSCLCKNSSCKAILSMDDSFCRRCSCCICHLYDDNRDPSLWLVCESEYAGDDCCGLTCHIECAFQQGKVGVANTGQFMQIDGNYSCTSCGKVSGILRFWKKQLAVAREARRVDILCHRVSLSYRLLDGTSRFKALHEIVKDVKSKLEAEVGPINEVSEKMGRATVNRLSVAGDAQKLCTDAIEKADEWLSNASNWAPNSRVDSLPAACRFLFEEVTSSSIVIVLIEIPTALTDSTKGYKLWCSGGRQEAFSNVPFRSFPREHRRLLISNLQPSTEYTFRIVAYGDAGDLGSSEAKCFTKSVDIIQKKPNPSGTVNFEKDNPCLDGNCPDTKVNCMGAKEANGSPSVLKVSDIAKIFHPVNTQQKGCVEGFCNAAMERHCAGVDVTTKYQVVEDKKSPPTTRGLDLNVVSVPDLNEDVNPPLDSSRDEDNGCTLERAVGADDDAASHGTQKNGQAKVSLKRSSSPNEETLDCDSTLIYGSPFRAPVGLDENLEECVKMIRWLECKGHIEPEFRLKFLTWFCLRSTVQERRVVNTFIQTLSDDAKSLAGQLVDSFSDIISKKRTKHSFTGNFP